MKLGLAAIALLFGCSSLSLGTDAVVYRGLGALNAASEWIAVSDEVTAAFTKVRAPVFTATWKKALKNNLPEESALFVTFPDDIPRAGLGNHILFIGKFSDEEKKRYRFSEKMEAGRVLQAVPDSTATREAIEDWQKLETPEERYDFAKKYLESKEPFLLESAWIVLNELVKADPGILSADESTFKKVKAGASRKEVADLAVQILVDDQTKEARDALRELALDSSLSRETRQKGVVGLSRSTVGYAWIQSWKDGKDGADSFLAEISTAIFISREDIRPALTQEARTTLWANLDSKDSVIRRGAIRELGGYSPTVEIIDKLKEQLAAEATFQNKAEVLAAISALGSARKDGHLVAPVLEAAALAESEPKLLRRTAILYLSGLRDQTVAKAGLKKIASGAIDEEIQQYAEGLR